MKHYIVVNLPLQVITCELCGEELEIRRSLLRDQHALLELQEATRKDHRECFQYRHDPEHGKLQRGFRKRAERELAKLKAQTTARQRCNGRRSPGA